MPQPRCPKCHGGLYLDTQETPPEPCCLSCGWRSYPAPLPHTLGEEPLRKRRTIHERTRRQ